MITPHEKQELHRDTSVFLSIMITIAILTLIALIAYYIVKINYLKKKQPVTKIETLATYNKNDQR